MIKNTKILEQWCNRLGRTIKTSLVDQPLIGHAVLSKYPAAFFSKAAFDLCSKDDTKMWIEKRHCHLLLFAPQFKRLIGMAMVYIQQIPELSPNQECLVIRGINTGTLNQMKFDPTSVVDEVMRVVIRIARDNNLMAVLFPDSSTHLSNQDDILVARTKSSIMKQAKKLSSKNKIFHCRELEQDRDAISELYIAWQKE